MTCSLSTSVRPISSFSKCCPSWAAGAISCLSHHLARAPRSARDTDMSNFTKTEEGRATVMAMQTLKRIGQPDDIASVIAFLVSDDARCITGETIAVDGGSKL